MTAPKPTSPTKPDKPLSDLLLAHDYATLMGAFVERKKQLGLTNLELDELGGLASGYVSKLFCGSKRLGLETLGKMLTALDVALVVVDRKGLSLDPGTNPIRRLRPVSKDFFASCGRIGGKIGGKKRYHLMSPARRRASAAMAGRASGEARRLRKLGLEPVAKTADPAIMRKLERRPAKNEKRPPSMSTPTGGGLSKRDPLCKSSGAARDPAPGPVEDRDFSMSLDPFDLGKP